MLLMLANLSLRQSTVNMKNRNDAVTRRRADAAVRKHFLEINYDFLCYIGSFFVTLQIRRCLLINNKQGIHNTL